VLLAGEELAGPIVHSVQPALAYLSNGALYTTKLDGLKPVALPTEPGRVLDVAWSPAMERDDLRLLYLHADAAGRTVNLREYDMNARRDRLVALTSQYAAFSPNADASVFAGASFSKAQPHVLMLVRSVGRELTLCEHQSPDATKVTPLFTPDSQQIFFASMREGKPAIYSIAVEKLVEATEDNSNRN
jgi:oligogalacturonide lyase